MKAITTLFKKLSEFHHRRTKDHKVPSLDAACRRQMTDHFNAYLAVSAFRIAAEVLPNKQAAAMEVLYGAQQSWLAGFDKGFEALLGSLPHSVVSDAAAKKEIDEVRVKGREAMLSMMAEVTDEYIDLMDAPLPEKWRVNPAPFAKKEEGQPA
jgi:hypothetical protein